MGHHEYSRVQSSSAKVNCKILEILLATKVIGIVVDDHQTFGKHAKQLKNVTDACMLSRHQQRL